PVAERGELLRDPRRFVSEDPIHDIRPDGPIAGLEPDDDDRALLGDGTDAQHPQPHADGGVLGSVWWRRELSGQRRDDPRRERHKRDRPGDSRLWLLAVPTDIPPRHPEAVGVWPG